MWTGLIWLRIERKLLNEEIDRACSTNEGEEERICGIVRKESQKEIDH
jgi:hypothetical protein